MCRYFSGMDSLWYSDQKILHKAFSARAENSSECMNNRGLTESDNPFRAAMPHSRAGVAFWLRGVYICSNLFGPFLRARISPLIVQVCTSSAVSVDRELRARGA